MDWTLDSTFLCSCGKSFSQPGRLTFHQKSCKKGKRRLADAFEKARESWRQRKRLRVEDLTASHIEASQQSPSGVIANSIPPTIQYEESGDIPHTNFLDEDASVPVEIDHRPLAQRKGHRVSRLPRRFADIEPLPLPLLPPAPEILQSTTPSPPGALPLVPSSSGQTSPNPSQVSRIPRIFRTPRNIFGLSRQYHSAELPTHDPEEYIGLLDLSDQSADFGSSSTAMNRKAPQPTGGNPFYPFPNENSFRLGSWYWDHGAQKSRESFRELLRIVGDPRFCPDDVRDTQWAKVDDKLGRNDFDGEDVDEAGEEWEDEDAGWTKTPIHISVPFHSRTKKPGPRDYLAGHLYHRKLVSVIREKIANSRDNQQFYYEPFELFWQPTETTPNIRVHGELYTSPAFLEAHRQLQEMPGEPGCDLPRVMVAMMFWSDSTHLTQFGDTHLWPNYLYFGNESKYRRCKPTCHLCNHVAYFEVLPDAFKDFACENMNGTRPSDRLITHCRREVLHAQWEILLDDEFMDAYEHGIVIRCWDEITRRFYPRIITYSADYKEKIILATIRNRGYCPCPRCLVPLTRFHSMGMKRDMKERDALARVDSEAWRRKINAAREIIYQKNYAVDSAPVELILKEESLVPTKNAFSQKLSKFGFNFFSMFVVDIMHEFELGVWKELFIHLLRILDAQDKTLINELDRRFRQVPTFGRDTIRRFSSNISELKKLAARDFEDILQCAIPVFDGLLPEPHNGAILQLIFICAHWHGLAKLRLHTDDTLRILDETTVRIGDKFRQFTAKTCSAFDTKELDREFGARMRRQEKEAQGRPTAQKSAANGSRRKKFNLLRYKYHSLGDYAKMIRHFGTTDSYSTEIGELEHRTPKARYKRTDKKLFIKQLARIERRETRLRRIRTRLSRDRSTDEKVPNTPHGHHHIGTSQNQFEHIGTFLSRNSGDPATKSFLPKLKQHVLSRIADAAGASVAETERNPGNVLFKHDRMYPHSLLRINYTTYDVRRSQDIMKASTSHCNVMVLIDVGDDEYANHHPFRYARVLGVYHVNAVYIGPGMVDYQPHRIEFLWVRWYQVQGTSSPLWGNYKLDRIQFPPVADDDAFGFIDPSDVLRGCHIIPSFARGKSHPDGRGLSLCGHDSSDWAGYYVNRFVDRDMLMRYHFGLGVGHVYAHHSASGGSNRSGSPEEDMGEFDSETLGDDRPGGLAIEAVHSEQESSSDDSTDNDGYSQDDPTDDEEFYAREEMYGF